MDSTTNSASTMDWMKATENMTVFAYDVEPDPTRAATQSTVMMTFDPPVLDPQMPLPLTA